MSEIYQQQRYNPNCYYFAVLADYNLDNKPAAKDFLDDGIDMAKDYAWNAKKFEELSIKLNID